MILNDGRLAYSTSTNKAYAFYMQALPLNFSGNLYDLFPIESQFSPARSEIWRVRLSGTTLPDPESMITDRTVVDSWIDIYTEAGLVDLITPYLS